MTEPAGLYPNDKINNLFEDLLDIDLQMLQLIHMLEDYKGDLPKKDVAIIHLKAFQKVADLEADRMAEELGLSDPDDEKDRQMEIGLKREGF